MTLIALILTCNRPFYNERREANSATWQKLVEAGFKVIFLFADPSLSESSSFIQIAPATFNLTVKEVESYWTLVHKIQKAYHFLNTEFPDLIGILKMDDNTVIRDASCLSELIEKDMKADYLGLVSWQRHPHNLTPLKDGPRFPAFMNNLVAKFDRSFFYFTGPFYWISQRVLKWITEDPESLQYPWEDLAVGYRIALSPEFHSLKKVRMSWKSQGRVTWEENTEGSR